MKKNIEFAIFILAITIFYGVVPFWNWLLDDNLNYFILLAQMTVVSVFSMLVGYWAPLFDVYMKSAKRIVVSKIAVTWIIPLLFLIFCIYTIYTAPSIPIFSALAGAAHELLSEERGAFLKGRTGIDSYLIYVSTIFVNTVIPYALVFLFAISARHRFYLFGTFFVYSIAFLQKALFLNVLLPLLFYSFAIGKLKFTSIFKVMIASVLILLLFISGTTEEGDNSSLMGSGFLSSQYMPSGPFDFLLWRALAVPIYTASDSLEVHRELFGAELLMGATSSMIAQIFGLERINIERHVFEYQFGGWNDVANANAVFFIDGYINFGWLGVILYSCIVGQIFRVLLKTRDKALSSISILFAMGAFSGSLLGVLFSNGWILAVMYAMLFKNKNIEILMKNRRKN